MKHELLLLPTPEEVQNTWDYFWYQLPYAAPSFISFGVGLLLFLIGIFAYFLFQRKFEYLVYSVLTLSYGFLSLVLGIRAVVWNEQTLLELHRFLYIPALFLTVSTSHALYELTERKYKHLIFVNIFLLGIIIWASVELISGRAFQNSWNIFSFGKYPKGNTAMRVWGLSAVITLYLVFFPTSIHYLVKNYKQKPINWNLFISLFLFSSLTSTNMPSLIGYNIFPGGALNFIPMLYLTYGILKKDVLNLNKLLYEKNLLFYIISLFVSFLFFVLSILIVYYISADSHILDNKPPYFLIPLFSMFVIFLFVIFIAGNDSTQKIWILSAIALLFNGLFAFILTVRAINLPILVSQRIEQLVYILISFSPVFQWRLIFSLLNLSGNKLTLLIDILCGVASLLTITPYFFDGYYSYEFGTISRAGLGLQLLSAVSFFTLFYLSYIWYKNRKITQNKIVNLVIASFLLGGFFILSGFPATLGYPLYSLANFQFIPTLLIVRAYFLHGQFVKGHGYKLSNNIIILVTIGTVLSMFYYYVALSKYSSSDVIHYVLLLFPTFYLSFFSFVFLLVRPIAKELDSNYYQLITTNEELKNTKAQVEGLNKLSNLINSTTNIPVIMNYIYHYLNEKFQVEAFWLLGVDENKQVITTIFSINNFIPESIREYYNNYVFPLNSRGAGGFYKVYKTKETLIWNYDPRLERLIQEGKTIDLQIVRDLRLKTLINIPLIIQDKVIAILSLTSYQENYQFSENMLFQVKIFAEQISGTIYKSKILKETEEAKELLAKQKQILELQKQEAEDLNHLFKELNQELNIQVMMQKLNAFILKYYDFEYYILSIIDHKTKIIRIIEFSYPESSSPEIVQKIKNYEIHLNTILGGHRAVFESNKFLFFRKIDLRYLSESEKFIVESLNVQSILISPLVLQGEIIGFVDFFSDKSLAISKEQILKLNYLVSQITSVIHSAFLYEEVQKERDKSEKLLLNILPEEVAFELKEKGYSEPTMFEIVTVVFTDFKGFTKIAEKMNPTELIRELDACFIQFDKIITRNNLEKLKTIGDSYMFAGGIPKKNKTNPIDAVLASLEIRDFMIQMKEIKQALGLDYWELRIGLHTGPLVAGVIGEKKFAYDVWGDTVNTASRMESSGIPNEINISESSYHYIKEFFDCEYRGKVSAKNKGEIDMYLVKGLKPEFSENGNKRTPNAFFLEKYNELSKL